MTSGGNLMKPQKPMRLMGNGKIVVEYSLGGGLLATVGLRGVMKDLQQCCEEVPDCSFVAEIQEGYDGPEPWYYVRGYRQPTDEEMVVLMDQVSHEDEEQLRIIVSQIMAIDRRHPDWFIHKDEPFKKAVRAFLAKQPRRHVHGDLGISVVEETGEEPAGDE